MAEDNNGTQYYTQSPPPQGEGGYGSPPPQGDGAYQSPPQQNVYYGQNNLYTDMVPDGVKGWNWGAFVYNWIWGIANHAYLALLTFVPLLNIVWVFVCGAKGNEWAWKSGEFKDVETFRRVQRTWNRAGIVYFIVEVVGVIIAIAFYAAIIAMFASFFHSGDLNPNLIFDDYSDYSLG